MASGYKTHAKNYAKTLIAKFKCVKKETLEKLLSDIDNVEYPETITKDLLYNTSIKEKEFNGIKYLVRDITIKLNEDYVYSFEAFCSLIRLIKDIEKKAGKQTPEWMNDTEYLKISRISEGEYPYDFVFSYGNELYLITCLGQNANRKLQFHNMTINKVLEENEKMDDPVSYIFVPVIPKKYGAMSIGETVKCNTLVAHLGGNNGTCKFERMSKNDK